MYQNELYHHGVKGMKWGVRKSKDERIALKADRYRENEIRKVSRKHNVDWNERRANRALSKYNKAVSKQKSSDKIQRTKKRLDASVYYSEQAKAWTNAEVNRLKNMSVAELNKEKHTVAALRGANFVSVVGTSMAGGRVAFTVDTGVYRTDSRLSAQDKRDANAKANAETKRRMKEYTR